MKPEMTVASDEWRVTRLGARAVCPVTRHPSPVTRTGFTMVEMLVTLALLSLIVLALMAVFNSTQSAFRAGLTETDILESGRMAMGLIADDLEKTTPSYSIYSPYQLQSNLGLNARFGYAFINGPVNFYINANPYNPAAPGYQPLVQYLPGTSAQRSNVLEIFFMLSRQNINGNPSWVGTGYAVDPASKPTNSLYRFVMVTNVMKGNPLGLFNVFTASLNNFGPGNRENSSFANTTNWTHIMDGVVELRVRAYDPDGFRITNFADVYNGQTNLNTNTYVFPAPNQANFAIPSALKMYTCAMFSNAVPASVEVDLGVIEDAVLQRAEGLPNFAPVYAQTAYLSNHVGQVHLFRERVWIRNLDPTAYQTQ